MSTITLENAIANNSTVSACDGKEKVVLSYTKSDNTPGIETVPVTYFTQGGGSIDTGYMSDYIKYVNIFNNLADISGKDALVNTYLAELSPQQSGVSVCPSIRDVFNINNQSFREQPNTSWTYQGVYAAFFNRMYWIAKSGQYIDISGNLKYFLDYDSFVQNKSAIDNTYIGVVHSTYYLMPEYSEGGSLMPGVTKNTCAAANIAVSKLSEVFGRKDQAPITLYKESFIQFAYCDADVTIALRLCTNTPYIAYKLIHYRCNTQFNAM